ncbi:MAG: hypothetical protein WKF67_06020 [Rubrobacteraceae bacterium]
MGPPRNSRDEAARRSRAKRREAEAAMTPDERLDRSLMKKGLTREEIDEKKRRMNEVIKRGNK